MATKKWQFFFSFFTLIALLSSASHCYFRVFFKTTSINAQMNCATGRAALHCLLSFLNLTSPNFFLSCLHDPLTSTDTFFCQGGHWGQTVNHIWQKQTSLNCADRLGSRDRKRLRSHACGHKHTVVVPVNSLQIRALSSLVCLLIPIVSCNQGRPQCGTCIFARAHTYTHVHTHTLVK